MELDCIYISNPGSGFGKEHTGIYCVYEHNPRQQVLWHIRLDNWCGNVCDYCKDRLSHGHSGAEATVIPPWKRQLKSLPL